MAKKIDRKFFYTVCSRDNEMVDKLVSLHTALQQMQIPPEVTLSLPPNYGLRTLYMHIGQGKKLTFISTGCPDYSNRDGRYTFESLGEGVSMLPRMHLAVARVLLPIFMRHEIDFKYYILVADLAEGTDPVVVAKFCNESMEEFLRRCQATTYGMTQLIENHFPPELANKMHAQTFSEFYGERYTQTQTEFLNLILQKRIEDGSFAQNFVVVHADRIPLYRQFLAGFIDNPTEEQLVRRTANGIAQYLTHFTLLRLEQEAPVMINHRTINLRWVNRIDFARSPKEAKRLGQKPRIPVFVIENKIY